jgi:hypothetical protein
MPILTGKNHCPHSIRGESAMLLMGSSGCCGHSSRRGALCPAIGSMRCLWMSVDFECLCGLCKRSFLVSNRRRWRASALRNGSSRPFGQRWRILNPTQKRRLLKRPGCDVAQFRAGFKRNRCK